MRAKTRFTYWRILSILLITCLLPTQVALAEAPPYPTLSDSPADVVKERPSTRLIVELESPPLAVAFARSAGTNAQLDINSADAQNYINQLQAEQAAFLSSMQNVLPDASESTYLNENGSSVQAAYQVVFNGVSVDVGTTDRQAARRQLTQIAGVKRVYLDQVYNTQLYTSTALINAPLLWNSPAIGGRANAGDGIKIASMDGGVHHDAAMMDGSGYSYPDGYGPNGLGETANNNGKIIVSRAYFRPWDPPAPGDENPWPGTLGTSHGMHTASIAAGDIVTNASYLGFTIGAMSGVAPKAYVMSYRVFYYSVNGIESFYTTEGLAALEDIVKDGADVVNNSWGGGPSSSGGEFDALDQALINAADAGIFVSMSTGNAGPGPSTSDHPSGDYISVAASTTSGTLATGRLTLPADPSLGNIPFASADFGAPLPIQQVLDYDYLPSDAVNPANIEGCDPWPAGSFNNKAALIERGACDFSIKVLNAQNAGAKFVIVYNHVAGGEGLINMSAGEGAQDVTISSVFIGHSDGVALVNHHTSSPSTASVELNTFAFQLGNVPDRIIDFSSRGPGVGNTLKPDIAAPGVNILAQGFTPNTSGEARHLGYGQVSGTSMAAPHVAGAGALVLQAHPDWSPAAIKSALMSTAKYLDIYLDNGVTPAQPLDMGAGRLDLTHAIDPGVLLDPPSLSFALVPTGTQKVMTITVTSVATTTETYNLSTLYTGDSFTATTALPGFTLDTSSLTLAPGESKNIHVTFKSLTSQGIGDNQGYVILDGPTHDAHFPVWGRVTYATPLADVLIIDNDFSEFGPPNGFDTHDYLAYYTSALTQLGLTYAVVDWDEESLPDTVDLQAFRAIIWFTGENYEPDAGLEVIETDRLMEYLNNGGSLIAMGQDLAATVDADEIDSQNAPFLYSFAFGANWIQDSVTNNRTPDSLVLPAAGAPAVFDDLAIDLIRPHAYDGAGDLSGDAEVPPVTTDASGFFDFYFQVDADYLLFHITVEPTVTTPITVTGITLNVGEEGVDGPAIRDLAESAGITMPVMITDGLSIAGVITPSLTFSERVAALNDGLYVDVQTSDNPGGELRGQVVPLAADNQPYMDELDNHFHDGSDDPAGIDNFNSTPILYYPSAFNQVNGTVALAKRDQPSLENPGITYQGRTIYTSFGLEGLYPFFDPVFGITPTSPSELLGTFLDWTWSDPATAIITNTSPSNESHLTSFSAGLASGQPVSYRYDFGDGSPFSPVRPTPEVEHNYACGLYTVRVEITDTYGNVSIGSKDILIEQNCTTPPLHLPLIFNNPPGSQ